MVGCIARDFSCRISPPGEFCTSTFSTSPEWHEFPVCCLLKSVAVRISLAAVPRCTTVPQVVCSHSQHRSTIEQTTTYKQTAATKTCNDGATKGDIAHSHAAQAQLASLHTSTPQPSSGAIPKLSKYRNSPVFHQQQPTEDTRHSSVREPPPRKVLYTKTSDAAQAYYANGQMPSPDVDYLLSKTLGGSTELEPLSPVDMQLYLLSLGGTFHDRAEAPLGGDDTVKLATVSKQPTRRNLLRTFSDNKSRRATETTAETTPAPKCKSPPLLQQQQCQPSQQSQRNIFYSLKGCHANTCHSCDTDVCHNDGQSDGSKTASHCGDDCKGPSTDRKSGVTFNIGDNEPVADVRCASRNTELQSDISSNPSKGSVNDDTLLFADESSRNGNTSFRRDNDSGNGVASFRNGTENSDTSFRRSCSTSSRRPFHKSVSMPTYKPAKFPGFSNMSCLLRPGIRTELASGARQVFTSLSLPLALLLARSLSLALSLSLSRSLALSLSFSLSLSISDCLSVCLFVCVSLFSPC